MDGRGRLLERHTQSSGARSFVVRDENATVVVGAETVLPHAGRRARIEWAPNPIVSSLSELVAAQIAQGLDELRENVRQLNESYGL